MGLDEIFLTQAFAKHYYTLACSGMKMHCKEFSSREQAKEYMYKLIDKHGLTLKDKWKDNHDVTYVCDNNVKFYIQRV